MAGEPALEKVITALHATIDAALPNATVDIERPASQAYSSGEIADGAINIIHTKTVFEAPWDGDQATTLHQVSFDIDMIVDPTVVSTITQRLRVMEADIIAALYADRTLGGLVLDIIPQSSGGVAAQYSGGGARPLFILILFLTPLGDHKTVIGSGGLIP
jgi:hypothetical protein